MNQESWRVRQGGFGKGNNEFKVTILNRPKVQTEEAAHELPQQVTQAERLRTPSATGNFRNQRVVVKKDTLSLICSSVTEQGGSQIYILSR